MNELKLNWLQRVLKFLGLLVVKTKKVVVYKESEPKIIKVGTNIPVLFSFSIQKPNGTLRTIFEITDICSENSFKADVYYINSKNQKKRLNISSSDFIIRASENSHNYKFIFKDKK